MKRTLLAAALALSSLALAEPNDGASASDKVSEAAHNVKTGAKQLAKDVGLTHETDPRVFASGAQAYSMEGTVSKTSGSSVNLVRRGLPTAELAVRAGTAVTLDGHASAVKDLPEGASVRADFQLDGAQPVAVRVVASSR